MSATSIEWTDHSINPIRARLRDAAHASVTKGGYGSGVGHYCEKISPGCAFCYSSGSQPRFGMPEFPGAGKGEPAAELFFDESRLREVLRRKAPTKWFWCDMTDLFGRWVPDEWIDKCFAVMALTPHHTHQILTKRPERMAEYLDRPSSDIASGESGWLESINRAAMAIFGRPAFPSQSLGMIDHVGWPLPNVWLGTSVEDQKRADERIPHLLRCPAAVRFLSVEPMLGTINFDSLEGIHQVIIGGEIGSNARVFDVLWSEPIIEQCRDAGVACFVKQLGSRPIIGGISKAHGWDSWILADGLVNCKTGAIHLRDRKGGNMEEWPEHLRVRQFPKAREAVLA